MKKLILLLCLLSFFACKKRCNPDFESKEMDIQYVAPYDATIEMTCAFNVLNIELTVNGKVVMHVWQNDSDSYNVKEGNTYMITTDNDDKWGSTIIERRLCE